MPVRMRKEAWDSIATNEEEKKEPWQCWPCASVISSVCGASEMYCCKKDVNVKVFCMKCKKKELLLNVKSSEWLVCARDECQLRVHQRCVSAGCKCEVGVWYMLEVWLLCGIYGNYGAYMLYVLCKLMNKDKHIIHKSHYGVCFINLGVIIPKLYLKIVTIVL